jgi:hypothetical protein
MKILWKVRLLIKEKPSLQSRFFPPNFPFPKYKRKIWREKNYFAKEIHFAKERDPLINSLTFVQKLNPLRLFYMKGILFFYTSL